MTPPAPSQLFHFANVSSWAAWHSTPDPHPAQCPAPVTPNSRLLLLAGSDQVETIAPPARIWEPYPFSLSVKASGTRGAADGALCWSLRPGPGLVARAALSLRVPCPGDRSLRSGALVGPVVWRVPLGSFVSDAWAARPEAWGGAEAVVAESTTDPDFRLGSWSLSPAFQMPFRTCTAFSRAWVRSSSSLRSSELGVRAAKAKSHVVVPHPCKPEDRPGAAPGEGGWRFTWRRSFFSFWPWGWLRSRGLLWYPAKTQSSRGTSRRQGPGPRDTTGRLAWGTGPASQHQSLQGKGGKESTDNGQLGSG